MLAQPIYFGERCTHSVMTTLYICSALPQNTPALLFLHLSSPFPLRQTVQKALQKGTRLFINVQSYQISLRITVNRGHTKEVSLPTHSYIAPPLVTIGRQDIQGLSL